MKIIYTLTIFLILSLSSFAKTYYIYTAKNSGNWDNSGTWNIIARNDNVAKDKFIIPAALTVTADDVVNSLGYTDVELQISGTLKLGPSTTLYFGNNSKIDLFSTGLIEADGASQQIYIGSVAKYVGNKNKTLSGPLYADYSTGIAPNGFRAYTLMSLNDLSPAAQINVEKSTIIYASIKSIHIAFKSEVKASVSVKVINMNGNLVASQSFNRPGSKVNLEMNNLNSGVYVVFVTDSNNNTAVQKVFMK